MSNDSLATSTTAPSAQGGGSPVVVNMYRRWGDDSSGMPAEWTVLELSAIDANHLRSAISSAVAPNGFATKVYAKFPRTARTVALQHRLRGGGPGSPIRECGEDAQPEPAVEYLDTWPTDTPMADPPIAAVAPGSVGEGRENTNGGPGRISTDGAAHTSAGDLSGFQSPRSNGDDGPRRFASAA